MPDEVFELDDLELFELEDLDELELLELDLPDEEDDPEELLEETEEVEDWAREKLNPPTLPKPELLSNSGTRILFSRDEYLRVTPKRFATLASGFQSLVRTDEFLNSEIRMGSSTNPLDSFRSEDC